MSRRPSDPAPTIGRHAQNRIGRELRLIYAEILKSPLPESISTVLERLSSQEMVVGELKQAAAFMKQADRRWRTPATATQIDSEPVSKLYRAAK